MAHVGEDDADAGVEERELAQAMLQRRKIELGQREGLRRGREGNLGAALVAGVADNLQGRHGLAVAELHRVFLAVAPDRQFEDGRERVDDGDANAVQTTGDLVGVLVEFSAGMELGHDDLGRRDAFALVDVGRDAAPVVAHGARAVGVQADKHFGGVSRERFVDCVVDDLVDHVMQAGPVIGVADVHARPLAHGVEALQDLDRFCAVVRRDIAGGFSHVRSASARSAADREQKMNENHNGDLALKTACRTAQSDPANMLI